MKNWLKAWWWILVSAVLLCGSGVVPAIIPQAVPAANKTGNSTKFQLASGAFTSGDFLKYDASGNAIDGGALAAVATSGSASDITAGTLPVAQLPTVTVAHGGTGLTATTANALLAGGTTATGALQQATSFTTNGSTTITGDATSVLDMATNPGAQVKYAPIAPWFSTTDGICAAAAGSPACPAGSVIVSGTNEASFANDVSIAANVPATNRVIRVTWGFDRGSTGGPNVTIRLRACPTANLTRGNATACSSGGVALITSGASTTSSTSGTTPQVNGGVLIQQEGANLLGVSFMAYSLSGFPNFVTVSNPTQVSFTMTSAWTLYWTISFSAATAGNWFLQQQVVTEYVY